MKAFYIPQGLHFDFLAPTRLGCCGSSRCPRPPHLSASGIVWRFKSVMLFLLIGSGNLVWVKGRLLDPPYPGCFGNDVPRLPAGWVGGLIKSEERLR